MCVCVCDLKSAHSSVCFVADTYCTDFSSLHQNHTMKIAHVALRSDVVCCSMHKGAGHD